MNNKKYCVLISFFCSVVVLSYLGAQDFIVPKEQQKKSEKLSKSELKSSLGDVTKSVFNQTTHLAQLLGNLQIEMADLHERAIQPQKVSRSQSGEDQKGCSVVPHDHNNGASNVMQVTVPLYKEFGLVQVHLAQVQERFSDLAEKLVENKKPFKKASRQQLEEALSTMKSIEELLQHQEGEMRAFGGRFRKITCNNIQGRVNALHAMEKVITADRKEIQGIQDRLNHHECLKNS